MKTLLVSHSFPPHSTAGTETYTAELGLALAARGHGVEIFTAHKDISRSDLTLSRRVWRGLPVHEIVNNLYYTSFRETWDHPAIDATFAGVLERVRPDVVHVQHLLYLSCGIVAEAHARGIPIVFTLHDFWLECPRFGQRVHADGGVCHTIDFARCGTCLASFKYGQGSMERRVGGLIAGVRAGTGINLGPLARNTAARLSKSQPEERRATPDETLVATLAHAAEERSRTLAQRIVPRVARFLAPSRFLRDRFVREWAIPETRIEHLRFGVDLTRFAARPRTPSAKLRVVFLGSLVPLKGPHLLLEAWSLLPAELRARGSLELVGPGQHHPEYQALLLARALEVGATIGPALDRDGVAAKLASTDLLVVPSLWYENSPLVILEALAARTPLLVSDLGGMAELVEPGVSGYHFRMGDARDLSAKLADALAGRAGLERLYAQPIDLLRFEDHVAAVEARYRSAVEAPRQIT